MTDSNTQTTLQDLPGEILNQVAGHLSATSFSALRLTSKSIEANTYQNFIDRNFKHLSLELDVPNMQYVLSKLRSSNVASQVQTITFKPTSAEGLTQNPSSSIGQQVHKANEIHALLKEILGLLLSLMKVEICGSTTLAQALRVLEVITVPGLTSISIWSSRTPANSFHNVLIRHKESLRSMTLHQVLCTNPSWSPTLALIMNELNLDTLAMSELWSNDPRETEVGFLSLVERRKNRAMRDPVMRKF
ncbi:hypothetical protein M409DRAFT_22906 [Zasmidium cellare ATCC 36951]|uniref:F-box domain-containing protein n=1 Tax=Zasmidium cellare ATCC 36951 TaxID=1080233 RepID=A0A6A6CJR4_ZASCE|nr:uncharacterized protein M409DRAFT_22906 [Zasmidium cellare ATCC 36951]KAF2166853.1 hypothetical protein M409DRAFT_22906 [Zasmidium cellare ATCC 36951]